MARTKVLVVDDHEPFRQAVIDILSAQEKLAVVGEAADGAEALEQARQLLPEVVLMDLNMPGMKGVEATRALKEEVPSARILILTISDNDQDLGMAIQAGAHGYVLKNVPSSELIRAVLHVANGGVVVSPEMANRLLAQFDQGSFTSRQVEILKLMGQGISIQEM